ncbi:hypothetical protein M407DRAFT_31694 [Tulasnella calospora MUT 4182]|uniref:CBM1 domain-containing protein n=1 Tax=Tulasnella calospora MUT 4182 TaxID=1051891 RepID=A0A0C3PUV1_9AGAM|nr:hypothetical protein M407DRAFT_31694 [Tulasnella calospora MUT 4182]
MHKITLLTAVIASLSAAAHAGALLWYQCGGFSWTGPTDCDEGYCNKINEYYSMCLPLSELTSTTTTTTTMTP